MGLLEARCYDYHDDLDDTWHIQQRYESGCARAFTGTPDADIIQE